MTRNLFNPFVLSGYVGADYFCNRVAETEKILKSINNGQNLTLISPRRMGKSGLIRNVFNQDEIKNSIKIYVDILSTSNIVGFVNALSNAWIQQAFGAGKRKLNKVMDVLRSFRPVIRIDPFTGMPEVEIATRSEAEKVENLGNLFTRIGKEEAAIVIAIDEFQQILEYPEQNMEALLRTLVQEMPMVRFIFSGSKMHLMKAIFTESKRPFYQSTRMLFLEAIDTEDYTDFILEKFAKGRRVIDSEAVSWIMNWTRGHTYYVQYICNWLYGEGYTRITPATVSEVSRDILLELQPVFDNYRQLLSPRQFELLRAIAKEGSVKSVLSGSFIQAHSLGTPSTVRVSLQSMLEKDMLREFPEGYLVDDVFFSRWLEGGR